MLKRGKTIMRPDTTTGPRLGNEKIVVLDTCPPKVVRIDFGPPR